MFAITGITGKVGGIVARSLLAEGLPVRAVVRDAEKGKPWADLGCEVAIAEIEDSDALASAFKGTEGVFFMTPPNYNPEPGFPQTQRNCVSVKRAIEIARPGKIVFLSTVGAHVSEPNLLNNSSMTEQMLRSVDVPVCMLRAAWFMENAAWDVEDARAGVLSSFLQPLDHPIPMVAAKDIGHTAAKLLAESWSGHRIVELEGPGRYSANDIAAGFSAALGSAVGIRTVPRDTWEALFKSQGMSYPMPRIRMIDGFNEGWIDFEGGSAIERRFGTISLDTILRELVS
ncbi:NmrA family transcriptional regulator [Paraburkholderia acidicola]|uniref:NmrA family transcriptional regulator n=1 Tax=Paraburkholderia acidicola TaxID=1912599 RepID=A0A2A4ETD0_9BURK|nr:NmrA family NAD(P)-binding protein [Paraburkholderia acidicola]PCE24115.1 NmrA family transcriptional regulator [Paraburkholderia acidicola]